jgi:putative addiction module killer protein
MTYTIKKTAFFDKWLKNLKDIRSKMLVLNRLAKIENEGHFGDVAGLTGELQELRFFKSPGYRVYFVERNDELVILLAGGDKSTQKRDIKKAQQLLSGLDNED